MGLNCELRLVGQCAKELGANRPVNRGEFVTELNEKRLERIERKICGFKVGEARHKPSKLLRRRIGGAAGLASDDRVH